MANDKVIRNALTQKRTLWLASEELLVGERNEKKVGDKVCHARPKTHLVDRIP
jgi:hypothetical protein